MKTNITSIKLWIVILFTLSFQMIMAQFVGLGPAGSSTYNANSDKSNGTGQIHCIAFHPNYPTTNLIFAGTPYGGLFKSTDGANTWVQVSYFNTQEVTSVNAVAISYIGGVTTVYVATGSSNKHHPWVPSCGIYKSTDMGNNFSPVTNFNNLNGGFTFAKQKLTTGIALHPTNPNKYFVASSDGLYRTTDGGNSWQPVLTEFEPPADYLTNYNDIETPGIWSVHYSPNDTNVVYASGLNVYKSLTGGSANSFSTLTNTHFDANAPLSQSSGLPSINLLRRNMDIEVFNNTGDDNLYCTAVAAYSTSGIDLNYYYRVYYHDGISWQVCSTNGLLDQGNNNGGAAIDYLKMDAKPNAPGTIITGRTETRISYNYGNSWQVLTGYNTNAHCDIHAIRYEPNGTFALIGTDGGIYRYTVSPHAIVEKNNGLSVSTIWDMATSPTKKNHLSIGKQDNNYDYFNGTNWVQLGGGGDGYAPTWWDLSESNKFFYSINGEVDEYDISSATGSCVNVGNCADRDNADPCNNNGLSQIYQHPMPQFIDRFIARKELDGQTEIYFSNNPQHSRYYDVLDRINEPNVASIGGMLIPKSDPERLYVFTNVWGFWNNSILRKYNLNNYNLNDYQSNANFGTSDCNVPFTCNGSCFTDLKYLFPVLNATKFDQCKGFFYPTGVAVSSSNALNLWVSVGYNDKYFGLTQYTNNCNEAYRYRLMKSTDGGVNWSKDDVGLPAFPITQVVYVDGSNDALFCATANGRVFYKNAGLSSWQEVDVNLPRCMITKLEINYCTKRLYVATFGRGVFYLDLNTYAPHSAQVLNITSNTTWGNNYYDIGGDIVVKAGNTLSLSSTIVNMCKGCRITVEPTAKLFVTGSKITNSCGEAWYGIEVWGNNTKRQVRTDSVEAGTIGDQGICVITSTSTVEFMSDGIISGKRINALSYDLPKSGGQIIANGSSFKNNVISIDYAKYTPPADPSNPLGYSKTKIYNCVFDNNTIGLNKHIGMWGVRGVAIEGNTFDNNTSTTTYLPDNRGRGIFAQDAEFIALKNTLTQNINKFKNLTYGVRIEISSTMNYPIGSFVGTRINQAEFTNNKFGLYMQGTAFSKITQNTFTVPALTVGDLKSYGMYVQGSTLYKVQENVLSVPTQSSTALSYGILVNNNHSNGDFIRKNTTTNLRYGVVAVGQNSTGTVGGSGLEFKCNILNDSRKFDSWITENNVNGAVTVGSIRSNQGSCNGSNVFSPSNNDFDFQNLVTPIPELQLARNQQTLTYNYHSPINTTRFTPFYTQLVNTIGVIPCAISGWNYAAGCTTEIAPLDYQPAFKQEEEGVYGYQPALLNEWNNEINVLRHSIDGGDKEALKQEIEQANAFSIEDVYAELIAKEAISEEVLKKAIDNQFAEYGLEYLKDLIIKNSGLSDSVEDLLIARQLPYTNTDISEMEAEQNKLSPEDQKLSAIAVKEQDMEQALLQWAYQYAADGKADSAAAMLQLAETESMKGYRMFAHLNWGQLNEAKNTAESLKQNGLKSYLGLLQDLQAQSKDWKQATPSQIQELWSLYNAGGLGSNYAKAALALATDTSLAPYLPNEDVWSGKTEAPNKWRQMRTVNHATLSLNPNPANTELTLSYALEENTSLEISIADASGKTVYEITAQGSSIQQAINTAQWPNGIYMLKAVDSFGQKQYRKFSVQH